MNNVIREMPGFLPMINGVPFEPLGSFSISHPVAADLAEQFLAIEGFRLADADEIPEHLVPKVKAPAPVAQPTPAAEPVLTGTLAGVQDTDGNVRVLSELKKAELLEIAKGMEIAGCESMTKPELIAAIEAEEVEVSEAGAEDAEAAAAGAGEATGETSGDAGTDAGESDEQFF